MTQIKIPATYMRGGTSKGVFFKLDDLPMNAQQAGAARDALLLRVIGSPDPYLKHTDGMGGATSSTSKVVILSRSTQAGHDVDYLFGQVAIDRPFVDWSGNCGNLTSAVGAFAIRNQLFDTSSLPSDGIATVRIWQANIGKSIIVRIPMRGGAVQEIGNFYLDGVTFPAAEVQLEFLDPAGDGAIFPTGNLIDDLEVPGEKGLRASLVNAGIPTVFVNAQDLGLVGTELQAQVNSNQELLARLERIRAHGALRMGLISDVREAETRQHTPKVAWVGQPKPYVASSGAQVAADDIDLLVRAMSMGQLHHAMMGTAAVAIGIASAVPGTLVNLAAGGGELSTVRFGHPSGTLKVGGQVSKIEGQWRAEKALMSRSARVLMDGFVYVPSEQI